MQNPPPIALPLFFSNNNRERLFVTSRPSYLQMRASSQKCIMRPLILQMQQRTMAAQAFLRARNRYFVFSCFLHFRGTFLPLCWCVCRHLFPIFPSPKAKLIHLCSCKAGTKAQIQPSQFTPSLALMHTHVCTHTHFAFPSKRTAQFAPITPSPPLPTCRGDASLPNGPEPCTHLSGYCWGNWPLTPPLGNWCRRRQKCAAYSLLHWRKRSPAPSIDLIFPPLCSL